MQAYVVCRLAPACELLCGLRAFRCSDLFQYGAACELVAACFGYAAADCHTFQRGAVYEYAVSDRRHRIRNDNRGQRIASVERAVADRRHRFRNDNFPDCEIVCKCIRCNRGASLRELKLLRIAEYM